MKPIYAVGDIHGYSVRLEAALKWIEEDGGPDAEVVFVGDYVDRGPDVKGVIERLSMGLRSGKNWTCLLGNHDRSMKWFLETGRTDDHNISSGLHWFHERMGGSVSIGAYVNIPALLEKYAPEVTSLTAYGVNPMPSDMKEAARNELLQAMPQHHKDFLMGLSLSHEVDGKFFCHAGIRPGVPFDEQTEDDLVWIRNGWLDNSDDHGALIVHGHTALDYPKHYGNRVNLDGGAGFGRPLYPAVFEGDKVWLLTENGRQPLTPSV